jgi:hypothetical protein
MKIVKKILGRIKKSERFNSDLYRETESLFRSRQNNRLDELFRCLHPSTSTTSKMAIYSVYCGVRSNLSLSTNVRDQEHPFYFVSNNMECLDISANLGWRPIYFNVPLTSDVLVSALQSKVPRILPHKVPVLSDYEWLLYHDDKYTIPPSKLLEILVESVQEQKRFRITKHPFLKGGVLYEFAEAMRQERYFVQRDRILQYIQNSELNHKHLWNMRMFATGFMVRNMHNPDVLSFCEDWFSDVLKCGIECQISFDCLVSKFGDELVTELDQSSLSN